MNQHIYTADQLKAMFKNPLLHAYRTGIVKDVDKTRGLVKVELQPEGIVTDFIRYKGMGITLGNWRAMELPTNETEVALLATDPECKSFIALGGLFNDEDPPPADYVLGTILWEHQNGNKFLMDADGMLYLGGKPASQFFVLQSWIVNTFNALVSAVNAAILFLNTHTHGNGNFGGPTTPPIGSAGSATPWSSGDVTTKVKAL